MSGRSSCSLVELTVLEAFYAVVGRRSRALVVSAKVLGGVEERIGLGPRHAHELLLTWLVRGLSLSPPWPWWATKGGQAHSGACRP